MKLHDLPQAGIKPANGTTKNICCTGIADGQRANDLVPDKTYRTREASVRLLSQLRKAGLREIKRMERELFFLRVRLFFTRSARCVSATIKLLALYLIVLTCDLVEGICFKSRYPMCRGRWHFPSPN